MNRNQKVTFNKQIRRQELPAFMVLQEPTVVAMEACYSSHYWAREFINMGHEVTLLPAQHVTPFVRGNKSDYNDAVAIAEASKRPNLTRVPIKTVEQQDIQSPHRIRERYVKHRTGLMNQARGLLSEYRIISPQGHAAFTGLMHRLMEKQSTGLTRIMRLQLIDICDDYYLLCDRIESINTELANIVKTNDICQRLLTIPGVGTINAIAMYSAIGNGQR